VVVGFIVVDKVVRCFVVFVVGISVRFVVTLSVVRLSVGGCSVVRPSVGGCSVVRLTVGGSSVVRLCFGVTVTIEKKVTSIYAINSLLIKYYKKDFS
jgi:hypothetical protein